MFRRDFLKITAAALAAGLTPPGLVSESGPIVERPNLIVILCDAFSAAHLSLHGYPRQTTPNIDAFAGRSLVYHNHYSGGNFTTTGTASMLSGMNAWKHRAINYEGLVTSDHIKTNPFSALGSAYHRFAFAQNIWPVRLLDQYHEDIDRFLAPFSYSLMKDYSLKWIFKNDPLLASIAVDDLLLTVEAESPAASSVLGYIKKRRVLESEQSQKSPRYPKGFPEIMQNGYLIPYINEDVFKGILTELSALEQAGSPYFAYFHLWSPHYPYRPRSDFRNLFKDGYTPFTKPVHPLSLGVGEDYALSQRVLYDQQIAQIDEEFGQLIIQLEAQGILDRSYVFFTSDHGELFERGSVGHGHELMYDPVIRIPLIVHAPLQSERRDVFDLTSNIDLLPTLLSLAGKETPPEVEGKVLPGLGGFVDEARSIFSIFAIRNSAFMPIKRAAISMRKKAHQLIAYPGYPEVGRDYELYDLETDPEELLDLAPQSPHVFAGLKDEFLTYFNSANQPFL